MKLSLVILTLFLIGLSLAQEEKKQTYLDPKCMKEYFYKSLEACLTTPPPCDECTCPRLKSECSSASGWANGATIDNVQCCKNTDWAQRYQSDAYEELICDYLTCCKILPILYKLSLLFSIQVPHFHLQQRILGLQGELSLNQSHRYIDWPNPKLKKQRRCIFF